MDDIPTPLVIGLGLVVVVVALFVRPNTATAGGLQIVPSDPGLDAIAQQEVNAKQGAFTSLVSYAAQIETASTAALMNEHLAETQRLQAEDVQKIQADLEKTRIAAAQDVARTQASAQKHASNNSLIGDIVKGIGGTIGAILSIF